MPFLYLSPSTQEFNPYVTEGNEEYWMNLIADDMEPYLRASGINVTRNDPAGTAATAIRQSNLGDYGLHLAIHSNALPPPVSGTARGSIAFYYPGSAAGMRMAQIVVDNLKQIYPLPDLVRAEPTLTIGEVRRTKAPSVLVELAYHDNVDDALWIQNNINAIARNLVLSVTEFFGTPFLSPMPEQTATVTLTSGRLNLRNLPSSSAGVLLQIPNGATVTVINEYEQWYIIEYNDVIGFVRSEYLTLVP